MTAWSFTLFFLLKSKLPILCPFSLSLVRILINSKPNIFEVVQAIKHDLTMEFTLEEITDLLNGPLNDEDLYAICEKMCLAVLELDQNQCRKIMITRDSVFLGPEGNIKIEIGLFLLHLLYLPNEKKGLGRRP